MKTYSYMASIISATIGENGTINMNMNATHGVLLAGSSDEARQMTAELFYGTHNKYPTYIHINVQTTDYIKQLAQQST